MKTNLLPSGPYTGLFKKAYKGLLVLALTFTITSNSFAHTAQPFVFGCVTPGSNMTIDAIVTNAGASTYYQWQFMDNSGNWRCFINGVNVINGGNFTVSGSTLALTANDAPLLTINNVTTALENVLVRVLMRDNAYPSCNSAVQSGHNNTGNTYGGDDQALNETKAFRIHVFSNATICPPNAFACVGNLLVNGTDYYGGFEAVTFNSGTNAYTDNNFATGNGSTDYTNGPGATNKTYQSINNPYAKSTGYTRNIAPHTGNYQMVVEGSATTSATTDEVWFKDITLVTGLQYRFDVWVVRTDATIPTIALSINGIDIVSLNMSSFPIGTWKLIHGTYSSTSTGPKRVSIRETTGGKNFALDDICFSQCTNCAALPLHQFSLGAYLQGNNVNLKWIAENEMNTDNYIIERSIDGVNFDQIGSELPTGPLNMPIEYNYTDDIHSLSSQSIIYYRIKATDRENRYGYSNVAAIRLAKTAGVQVWPNPFSSAVNITYNAATSTKVDVSIVSCLGKMVKQSNYSVSHGLNQISVNGLETLSSGVYFIRITDKNTNEVYIQKISK